MPLIKTGHRVIPNRKISSVCDDVIKGDAEGIVVNTLVFVLVVELQIEIDGGVGGPDIISIVEGRNVKVLDGACWVGST